MIMNHQVRGYTNESEGMLAKLNWNRGDVDTGPFGQTPVPYIEPGSDARC